MGQYVADTATGASEIPGLEGLRGWATEYSKPSTEPGAWRPTTKEDVAATKGFLPTTKALANQYVMEPLAGMAGGLAIPIGAGAAVGAMSGPAGFITGPATTIAAATPSEYARNRQEVEQANKTRATLGQVPEETDKATSLATAILQGALYTGAGPVGKLTHAGMKAIGPEVAALTKAVERGELTKEAASAALNSRLRSVAESGIGNAIGGTEMMAGTEAMRMAQAGEDLTSPEALARYGTAAHEAGALALPLSLMGLRTRGQQMKQLAGGEKTLQGYEARASDMGGDRETYAQRTKDVSEGTPGDLFTPPAQPSGKKLFTPEDTQPRTESFTDEAIKPVQDNYYTPEQQSATIQYMQERGATPDQLAAKQAEMVANNKKVTATEPETADVLTTDFFNTLKVPKKSPLREYEGMPLDDPRIEQLRTKLTAAAEVTKDPKVVQRMQWGLDNLSRAAEAPKEQVGFEFKSPKEYAEQDAVAQQRAVSAKNDAEIQATYPAHLKDVQTQERAANQQARVDARLARPVTEPNAARDMFTGVQRVADMSKPAERAPAETMPELQDRSAALYDEFQKAHEEYQKTGNDARLNEVLAQAKEELGPMDDRLNRESTKPMFGKTGKPLKGALYEPKAATDQGAGGDRVPAPVSEAAKPTRVEPVAERVAAPEPVADRPVVGEKSVEPALDKKAEALRVRNEKAAAARAAKAEAPEVSEKTAGLEWEHGRGNDADWPAYKDLHRDAKDYLQAQMELNGGELTGPIMKKVRTAHKDAVRSEGIREELFPDLGEFLLVGRELRDQGCAGFDLICGEGKRVSAGGVGLS